MALQKQTFTSFTPAMFSAFSAKIKNDIGVEITGDAGTVTHGGFSMQYSYDSVAGILNIQCLTKPLFIPASTIINGLAEEVAALRAATLTAPAPSTETTL